MGTILFLLLLFFVIIPLFKVAWRIYKAQREFSRMQQQFRDAMHGATGHARPGARSAAARPRARKKKIDPNVGEYVAFEEIHTQSAPKSEPTPATKPESQIEDASWEEI